MPRFDKQVKIRKSHACSKCREVSPAGTIMLCQTNTEDIFTTDYFCLTCVQIEQNKPAMINWDVPKELADKPFDGNPDEYLEIKRAERRINQLIQ